MPFFEEMRSDAESVVRLMLEAGPQTKGQLRGRLGWSRDRLAPVVDWLHDRGVLLGPRSSMGDWRWRIDSVQAEAFLREVEAGRIA